MSLVRTFTPSRVLHLLYHLGPRAVLLRASYQLQLRTGLIQRRLPAHSWGKLSLGYWVRPEVPAEPLAYWRYRKTMGERFFFDAVDRAAYSLSLKRIQGSGSESLISEVNQLTKGVFRFFEAKDTFLGLPPNWHRNPLTGNTTPDGRYWSEIPDFGPAGDIKLIWEPSRFTWAYKLVRAFWLTGEETYPQCFWALVENWQRANPPQLGSNWKCGQETAFRLMACCFGLYGFAESSSTTPERVARLAAMIAAHALRIEKTLGYARSHSAGQYERGSDECDQPGIDFAQPEQLS